ncbi:hypothetical protein JCM8547_009214 [Rhodosporidiobolus lusitaniae]
METYYDIRNVRAKSRLMSREHRRGPRPFFPLSALQQLWFTAKPADVLRVPGNSGTMDVKELQDFTRKAIANLQKLTTLAWPDTTKTANQAISFLQGNILSSKSLVAKEWDNMRWPRLEDLEEEAMRVSKDDPARFWTRVDMERKDHEAIPNYQQLVVYLVLDTAQDCVNGEFLRAEDFLALRDDFGELMESYELLKKFMTGVWRWPIPPASFQPEPSTGQHRLSSRVAHLHGIDPAQFAQDAEDEMLHNARVVRPAREAMKRAMRE